MSWIFSITPSLLLSIAIIGAQISDNDKAPFLVIAAIVVDIVWLMVACVYALTTKHEKRSMWIRCAIVTFPLAYVAIVIVAMRADLIDSTKFLGFR